MSRTCFARSRDGGEGRATKRECGVADNIYEAVCAKLVVINKCGTGSQHIVRCEKCFGITAREGPRVMMMAVVKERSKLALDVVYLL